MIKVLLKKQMMEVFAWIYQDRKTGKNRSKAGTYRNLALYIVLFAFIAVLFYFVSFTLSPMISLGFGWLYFAMMGLIAICFGIVGSVFNTYASLYQAKDNDLLLSMPIPARTIIIVRLSGVLALGLMYELIVLIPALIVWFMNVQVNAAVIIGTIVTSIMISVFVLTLSAILGWVVAAVSSKMKRKNITTVIISLIFLLAYFFFYTKAFDYIQAVAANPEGVGNVVRSALYPFYQMGLAAEGNLVSMLIFAAMVCVLFAIVYTVISRSFIKLATTNKGAAKIQYKERQAKLRSADSALFIKELRRFTGSATYMLNAGVGLIFFPAAAVALIIFRDDVFNTVYALVGTDTDIICLAAAAVMCFLCTMVQISAPSVSLEGKNIWLVQSLPVTPVQVLLAKVRLHAVLTTVSAAVPVVVAEILLKPSLPFAILLPAIIILFIIFNASWGVMLNLKAPNLTWKDESIPVKQGMSVTIGIFGGWGITIGLCALYFLICSALRLSPVIFGLLLAILLLVMSLAVLKWIKTTGAGIFAEL